MLSERRAPYLTLGGIMALRRCEQTSMPALEVPEFGESG